MEKQKCPEIRFKGFNQAWIEKKLKSVSFKVIEKNLNSLYTETFTNSAQFGVVSQRDFFDKDISNSSSIKGYYVVKENDFIYNPRISNFAPVGPIKRNKLGRIGVVSPLYFVFRVHGLDYQFLETYFESSKWHHFMFLNGDTGARSDRLAIKDSILIEMLIYCPDEKTQKDIGNFFQNLDQSIALQEKKLSQTQNLKKAMLEKMFPKAGSNQPEVRLKGFSGDWDTINLGSLCYIGDIDHRMPESNTSGIPYLMTGDFFGINGLDFKNAKLISNQDYEQLSKKIKPEIGDILFARYASVGTVRLVVTDVKFLISYSCAILKTSVSSNGEYLFYWFQTSFAQNQIEQEINTGSQRNIGIDSLKKLSVSLPKTSEQKAIANFFKKLDETLALQQQQFQTLKNLKQAFLEKMFV